MRDAPNDAGTVPLSGVATVAALRGIHRQADHSIYLGQGTNGWVWAGAQRSALVLGPSRSGKTSSLVIPNLLLTDGPVVSTSTKPDVMRATAPARSQEGWSFLYDPSGDIECPKGVERMGWSPLTTADDWDRAVQTSDAMVRASRMGGSAVAHSPGEQHWTERASALLSPLLHAAALESLPMRSVLKWIDRHDGATPLQILAATVGDDATATDLLAGIVATDSREQSGIWSTASGVLAAYRSEGALASTVATPLDVAEFCRGPNTMYLCSAGRHQNQFSPLVVGVIGDVRDATYDRERSGEQGAPTLFALDEVANIAPIPDLPGMVSEGAGQGLLVLACLQDLSQARSRWGPPADGFFSLFGATVVMPGIADVATLRSLSALAGEQEIATTTVSQSVGHHGSIRPSSSVSTVRLPRYPVDAIARGVLGHAMVLTPERQVGQVLLTPAHVRSPWRELSSTERAVTGRAVTGRAPAEQRAPTEPVAPGHDTPGRGR
ncbi:MAG TPA: type IV secretory system conjugative DNA transfer family protein [Acidimicrobiales bacterium]|nr:type IV secretory system conjugative DNA transfer family protein [Acidimicrobiales bacterium]